MQASQNNKSNIPAELKAKFEEIDKKFLKRDRVILKNRNKEIDNILKSVSKDRFQLTKDILMASGTIFGSSIALASGRTVNQFFVIGEFFLLINVVTGMLLLQTHLSGKEWDFSFSSKNALQSFLISNKDRIPKFELDMMNDLIRNHEKLIKQNQSGLLYQALKIISLENWEKIYVLSFILGIMFIFMSIVPINYTFVSNSGYLFYFKYLKF